MVQCPSKVESMVLLNSEGRIATIVTLFAFKMFDFIFADLEIIVLGLGRGLLLNNALINLNYDCCLLIMMVKIQTNK